MNGKLGFVKSPRFQLVLNYTLFCGAWVGWPASALTWAREEPQFILGLSWLALILTTWGNIISSQVNKEVQAAAPLASADDEKCERGEK